MISIYNFRAQNLELIFALKLRLSDEEIP